MSGDEESIAGLWDDEDDDLDGYEVYDAEEEGYEHEIEEYEDLLRFANLPYEDTDDLDIEDLDTDELDRELDRLNSSWTVWGPPYVVLHNCSRNEFALAADYSESWYECPACFTRINEEKVRQLPSERTDIPKRYLPRNRSMGATSRPPGKSTGSIRRAGSDRPNRQQQSSKALPRKELSTPLPKRSQLPETKTPKVSVPRPTKEQQKIPDAEMALKRLERQVRASVRASGVGVSDNAIRRQPSDDWAFDPFLQMCLRLAELGFSLPVTLQIGGVVVSGVMIGSVQYVETLQQIFSAVEKFSAEEVRMYATVITLLEEETLIAKTIKGDWTIEAYAADLSKRPTPQISPLNFVHLRDVHIDSARQRIVRPVWRGRATAVEAFSFAFTEE